MSPMGNTVPSPITISSAGESCSAHCQSTGMVCDGARLVHVTGFEDFETLVGPYHLCPPPAVVDCSSAAPGLDENGSCLFQGSVDTCPRGVAAVASTCAVQAAAGHCDATNPAIRRFCACMPPPTMAPTVAPTMAPSSARARRGVTSSASAAAPNRLSTLLLGAVATLALGGVPSGGVGSVRGATALAALSIALWASPAAAHNWVITPARAMTEASTTAPCRSRKSSDDWHAQVGQGQDFAVKYVRHRAHNRAACLQYLRTHHSTHPHHTYHSLTSVYSLACRVVLPPIHLPPPPPHTPTHPPTPTHTPTHTLIPTPTRPHSPTHVRFSRWATGHERDAYWVILHGSNESWLSDRNFVNMVNSYIDNAPAGADTAQQPRYPPPPLPPSLVSIFRTTRHTSTPHLHTRDFLVTTCDPTRPLVGQPCATLGTRGPALGRT
jgi:hypothetical protein